MAIYPRDELPTIQLRNICAACAAPSSGLCSAGELENPYKRPSESSEPSEDTLSQESSTVELRHVSPARSSEAARSSARLSEGIRESALVSSPSDGSDGSDDEVLMRSNCIRRAP